MFSTSTELRLLPRDVKSTIKNTNGHDNISKIDNEEADMIRFNVLISN